MNYTISLSVYEVALLLNLLGETQQGLEDYQEELKRLGDRARPEECQDAAASLESVRGLRTRLERIGSEGEADPDIPY